MKKWKKLTALLLAMVMVLGLTGTAFAEETEYTDVPDWAKEYVDAVTEADLIDGKTATTFAPGENMTRADLVEALYRLAGKPAVSGENPFTDVDDNAAYKNAVIWASQQGIVGGKDTAGTVFDPTGDVKRQEIAKILNIFAAKQMKKDSLTNRIDELSGYPDAADVASWAKEYMNWAVASEFITGTTGNKLDPKGTATRAQVAAIICRYIDDNSTGDASKDKPRNGDNIGENELLVVSFGTSYNDNRVATIGAIENALEKAFPDYSVRRGFTANIIIEHVNRRDGEVIDDVKEALDRAVKNGVKNLLVQPTHLMNGYEYGDLRNLLEKKYADKFETIKIGAPLLTSDEDFKIVAEAMVSATASAVTDDKTAVCYMGHGTTAESNSIYTKMQQILKDAGHDNYFIGTVEAAPTAEDLVEMVKEGGYEKVILRPMMIVAGDHANNDMADENDEESWYSVFFAAGFSVECQINGLGEIGAVQQLLVEHAKNARPLNDTGITSQPNPENPDNEELENEAEAPAKTEALADGVYTIEVECEQSMFRIDSCELTVKDGEMTAALTLGSTSFDKMFAGTANAAKLAQEGVVDAVEADGKTTFALTVAALDQALDYAAHSVKNDTWYDRTLTFVSETAVAK
ncbi:MAG: hypothetical protein HDT15_10255 [Oscillibacter sp.]|nr:hypothetical protein [Oscillibacter sp.]